MGGWLERKTALITGIGAGIGQACAEVFAREGALVVGADIDADTAGRTAAQIQRAGGAIEGIYPCDVTRQDDVARLIEATAVHGLDIVVNAAAHCHFGGLAELDYQAAWRPTLAAEVDSVFLVTQAAWPHLISRGGGTILNFASVVAHRGAPEMIAHAAGKGAVLALTRQLAFEGGSHNIRANCISPGLVDTAATRARAAARKPGHNPKLDRMLIKRIGTPEDVAWACVYLASDRAAWITGIELPVDGGALAC